MNKEIWKDIKNYEGLYQVSNLGRVKSVERTVEHGYSKNITVAERILKDSKIRGAYLKVDLYKEGLRKSYTIHRLVLETFLDKPDNINDWHCDHINGIKSDNRLVNLQWLTQKQNNRKSFAKETLVFDMKNKILTVYETTRIASKEIGYSNPVTLRTSGIHRSGLMWNRYVAGYDTEQLWDNILRHSHKFNLSEKDLNKIKLQLE